MLRHVEEGSSSILECPQWDEVKHVTILNGELWSLRESAEEVRPLMQMGMTYNEAAALTNEAMKMTGIEDPRHHIEEDRTNLRAVERQSDASMFLRHSVFP